MSKHNHNQILISISSVYLDAEGVDLVLLEGSVHVSECVVHLFTAAAARTYTSKYHQSVHLLRLDATALSIYVCMHAQ